MSALPARRIELIEKTEPERANPTEQQNRPTLSLVSAKPLTISTRQEYHRDRIAIELVQELLGVAVPKEHDLKIRARGLCPVCRKSFVELPGIGFLCLEHKTRPERFLLDFWYKVSVPGSQKATKSVRTRIYSTKDGKTLETYSDATALRSVIEEELRNKTFDPEKYMQQKQALFLCSNLFEKFLDEKRKTIAPSYIGHYEQHIKILSDYFGNADVREIAGKRIYLKNLIKHLEDTYVKPGAWKAKTMKNCAEKMRAFLNWVHDDLELVPSVPAFPEILTDEPLHTWVQSWDQTKIFNTVKDEDKPIIGFLMLTGCRPGEARALKCKDVDLEGGYITIHATFSKEEYRPRRKGRNAKPLYIPIHPEAFDFLKARKSEALPEAWVFPNPRTGSHYRAGAITKLWNGVKKRLKLKGIRLYDASRHSYASQLVAAGVSIYKVKDLLGHTSVKTTEKNYAHTNLDSLRSEIANVSLKGNIAHLRSVSGRIVSDVSLQKSKRKKD